MVSSHCLILRRNTFISCILYMGLKTIGSLVAQCRNPVTRSLKRVGSKCTPLTTAMYGLQHVGNERIHPWTRIFFPTGFSCFCFYCLCFASSKCATSIQSHTSGSFGACNGDISFILPGTWFCFEVFLFDGGNCGPIIGQGHTLLKFKSV